MGLGLSAAMLLGGALLIAVRWARTTSDRFWVALLALQLEISVVLVACSLMERLDAPTLLAVQSALLAVTVVATRIGAVRPLGPEDRHQVGRGARVAAVVLAAGLAVLLAASAARQLAAPLTGFDDRMYHASRVAYWMQYGTIFFPETHNQRQTVFPFGAELWFAWPLLFVKQEAAGRIAFWLGFPLSALGVATLARAVGVGRVGQVAAALLYAATPMVLLKATSLKPDSWLPVFLLGAAYFAVRGSRPGESWWSHPFLAGASLALAMSVKMTALALAPGLLLVAVLERGWSQRARSIGALAAGLVVGIALSGLGVLWVRNAVAHGHPVGPPGLNHTHLAEVSPHQLYLHAVRAPLALLELPRLPHERVRLRLERAGRNIARATGAERLLSLEGEEAWPGRFSFSLPRVATSYSSGGLLWIPCLTLALLAAVLEWACSGPARALRRASLLAVCQLPLLVGVVFLIRWTSDGIRFWIGAYALSVPLTIAVLAGAGRRWPWLRWGLAAGLIWTVLTAADDEWTRLAQARHRAPDHHEEDEPYQEVLPTLPRGARILLVAHQDTREYPLFAPRAGYANQVYSWGREPFDPARAQALLDGRGITHVVVEDDREVLFHWAGGISTAELVAWLRTREGFRERPLQSGSMRLFERAAPPR